MLITVFLSGLAGFTVYVYMQQTVKRAVVKPIAKDGKVVGELLSEKKRYQVLWERWGWWVGLAAGFLIGWSI
jgi:hypothetical protein